MSAKRPPGGSRGVVPAAAFFLAATLLFSWPVAAHLNDGLADLWDAKLNAWILRWDYHQFLRDPFHLFDANTFYPSRFSLAFSENLLGASVFGFPLYAAGASTLTAYNVLFLLGMFLSALGAWALARYVTQDAVASCVAGLVYAFVPWRLSQVAHFQFQWGAFLPLSLLFLLKYWDHGRRRDQALFALFLAWNAAANVHYAIFSALLFALVLCYEALSHRRDQIGRLWGSLGAAALAVLLVIPLYVSYVKSSELYGAERGDAEIAFFSGRPSDFLTAGIQNRLYGPLTEQWGHPEGDFFPGLAAFGLAAFALIRVRRSVFPDKPIVSPIRRRLANGLDVVVLLGLALWIVATAFSWHTLGPVGLHDPGRILVWVTLIYLVRLAAAMPSRSHYASLRDLADRMRLPRRAGLFLLVSLLGVVVALGWHTPYYRFLVESAGPVFRSIRAPARGIVLFDLGLGVLASWGLASLRQGRGGVTRRALAVAAFLAIGFEYRAFPLENHPVDWQPPPVYSWLATVSVPGGVVHWPLDNMSDFEHEFRSTAHWKPIVNGSSGFAPPAYRELEAALALKPIPDSVWKMLSEREASLLLFHPGQLRPEATIAYAEAIGRGMSEGRIRLLRSFPDGEGRDYVFELPSSGAKLEPERDSARMENDRQALSTLRHPPFGYIDAPKEWETVSGGSWGYGWALDDSGVARVSGVLEDGTHIAVVYGLPHPGPPKVYPQYPGVERSGFSFQIPPLSAGTYKIIFTIHARDHGTQSLVRYVRVR